MRRSVEGKLGFEMVFAGPDVHKLVGARVFNADKTVDGGAIVESCRRCEADPKGSSCLVQVGGVASQAETQLTNPSTQPAESGSPGGQEGGARATVVGLAETGKADQRSGTCNTRRPSVSVSSFSENEDNIVLYRLSGHERFLAPIVLHHHHVTHHRKHTHRSGTFSISKFRKRQDAKVM